jgi:hypothetical protein
MGVAVSHPVEYLPHEAPNRRFGQADPLPDIVAPLPLVHEGLEIVRHEFEYQVQPPRRGLYHVQEEHDVVVRELAQQGYLAYDVARHPALGRRIGVRYALYGDGAIRGALRPAVYGAVCSLSDEVGAGVFVDMGRGERRGRRRSRRSGVGGG